MIDAVLAQFNGMNSGATFTLQVGAWVVVVYLLARHYY